MAHKSFKECGTNPSVTPGYSRNPIWAAFFSHSWKSQSYTFKCVCEKQIIYFYNESWHYMIWDTFLKMELPLRILYILKVKCFLPPLMSTDLSPQHQLFIKMGSPTLTVGQKSLGMGHTVLNL